MRWLLLLLTAIDIASAWQLPAALQQLFNSEKAVALKPQPLRFDNQTDCASYIAKLNTTSFIAYNYGLDEKTPGAGRDLVSCLASDDAAEVRPMIKMVYIAEPRIGEPKPKQKALLDLFELLPNLDIVCTHGHGRLWQVESWLNAARSSMPGTWKLEDTWDGPCDHVRRRDYFFDECASESLKFDDQPGLGIDKIYRAMTMCDNIRSLNIAFSRGGCVIGDNWHIRSFDWRDGDRFSTLEHLSLTGYEWDSERWEGNEWVQKSDAPMRPPSSGPWKRAMDWSKLKRLAIDRPTWDFMDTFRGELPALQSFTLGQNGGWETLCKFDQNTTSLRTGYEAFIISLPPLKELRIEGMGNLLNLTTILTVHGSTLETLAIHAYERACDYESSSTWTRPMLSMSDVERIVTSAPDLRHLELDINQGTNWKHPFLEKISRMQNLETVKLWFETGGRLKPTQFGDCGWEDCRSSELASGTMESYLNDHTALELFRILRKGQVVQTLEKAIFNVGSEAEGRMPNGMYNPYENDYETSFICKSLLKGEECTRLSARCW